MKRLVLLGSGPTHLQVLAALAREPLPQVEVALAAPHARPIHRAMLPGWVAGHYTLDQCSVALEPLARSAGADLALSAAVALDTAQRTVTLADGRVADYDVLSIDTDADMDHHAMPGAHERGLFVRPVEQFVQLFDRVLALAADHVIDVVVVGSGASGFELALAANHRLNGAGSQRASSNMRTQASPDKRARVCLVSGDGAVLPRGGERLRRLAVQALRGARITLLSQRAVEIGPAHVLLDNGARLVCDLPLLALPAAAPPWLRQSGLALDERGFINTTATLQSPSHPEVFVAGDLAAHTGPALCTSARAARAGAALALNLSRQLAGGRLAPWRPRQHELQLLWCGQRRAIAAWGGLAAQGRWAGWWKDRTDRDFIASLAVQPAAALSAVARDESVG